MDVVYEKNIYINAKKLIAAGKIVRGKGDNLWPQPPKLSQPLLLW